jgi:hypothetical protein
MAEMLISPANASPLQSHALLDEPVLIVDCSLESRRCHSVWEENTSLEAKRIESPVESLVDGDTRAARIVTEVPGPEQRGCKESP